MSTLVLVRHGQASFLADDYDKLSELGFEQSRRLGEYWAARRVHFDRAYVGPALRHRETADTIRACFEAAGAPFPDLQVHHGLDEFDSDHLVAHALDHANENDATIKPLFDRFHAAEEFAEKRRWFQKLFEAAADRWVRGELAAEEGESWAEFLDRVRGAVREMTAGSDRGERVVAFTSGGPVAATIRHALGVPPENTLSLVWTLRNAAWAQFIYTRDRFSLSEFNATPHLDEERLITYR